MVHLARSLASRLWGASSRSCMMVRQQSSARIPASLENHAGIRVVDRKEQPISRLAASLPKASHRLRFTSIPYRLETQLRPEGLRKAGLPPAAFQRSNPENSEWPTLAWSCQFFSINATPPSRVKAKSKDQKKNDWNTSPFPTTIPRKTRQDFGTPSLALDHLILEDKRISSDEKKALREENARQKSYVMSLTIYVSKKKIHKLAHVRNTIRKRIRAAIRLVVQGGIEPTGEGALKRAVTGPAHHLLPGHRYMVQTSLEVYRMPMDQLVPLMAQALREIYVSGQTQLADQALQEECNLEQIAMQSGAGTSD